MLNIFSEFINNFLISTYENVVSPVSLVGRDVLLIQCCGKRDDGLQLSLELPNKIRLEDSRALGSLVKISIGDVPTRDHEVSGSNQRQQVLYGFVHILQRSSLLIELETNVAGGALSERAEEVSALDAGLSFPRELVLVGKNTSDEGGTVVTAKTHQHHTQLRHLLLSHNRMLLLNVLIAALICTVDCVSLCKF